MWCTKYRRKALKGNIGLRLREIIRQICGDHDVIIMRGHISKDHVHLFISIPPQVCISRLMQY
ncbi:MAG: IS200/IS605 family transposase, partial [Deltaproteobacteria bacterium]|nr:IS200/IS605 family transposase [Deltaproteobacteria bacterium]